MLTRSVISTIAYLDEDFSNYHPDRQKFFADLAEAQKAYRQHEAEREIEARRKAALGERKRRRASLVEKVACIVVWTMVLAIVIYVSMK